MEPESSLRERLIDVGVDVVMTDGPASLGLREIARRAGVSHGAPRRYFPTHHALLSAIARRGFADLASRFEAAADEDAPPRDRLRTLARTYLRYASEHRGMFELMFRHDLLDSETQHSDLPPLRESTLPLFSHLVELVARHAAERTTAGPAAPPAVAAAALWTNLHGVAQLGAWGSLQLALNAASPGAAPDDGPVDPLDRLLMVVLDAHLGPVNA
ncbi:TetR/AcrR family transcriptional regulator [Streptomyces sp. P01-B04]|uniref:TetR/AcrR family transcriptional regulator n=1 Tax=Streptomyces poriferorum TaxID=2798799 RepID=UPI001C604F4E|nr:TetR/AcrR family transcriptional regulator [Streptomyces poriferorum]MBW5250154.1 TetR/AcrR family transcriptional regulator [Streptomyces poriferorum]MBW5258497.1 TetR/AcrR family transcriptional regulator [Streptomyces poriferorum]